MFTYKTVFISLLLSLFTTASAFVNASLINLNQTGITGSGDTFGLSLSYNTDSLPSFNANSNNVLVLSPITLTLGADTFTANGFRLGLVQSAQNPSFPDIFFINVLTDSDSALTISGPTVNGNSLFRFSWNLEAPNGTFNFSDWPISLSNSLVNSPTTDISFNALFTSDPTDPFNGQLTSQIALNRGMGSDIGVINAPQLVDVPEPSSLALFGIGMLGLGAWRRRKIQSEA